MRNRGSQQHQEGGSCSKLLQRGRSKLVKVAVAVDGTGEWRSCHGDASAVATENGAKMSDLGKEVESLSTAAAQGKMHHRPFDLPFALPVYEEPDLHEMQLAPKRTRVMGTARHKTNLAQDNFADHLVKRLLHIDVALARHLKEGRIKAGGEGAPICAGHNAV